MPRKSELRLQPELFDDIIDYITKLHSSRQSRSDETDGDFLIDDHPLVAFCQDLLEQVSATLLGQRIVGFGPHARRRLALERRRMERRGNQGPLVQLLFDLETVSSTLGTAKYVRSEEHTEEFLRTDFLALLKSLSSYLGGARPRSEAAEAAANALTELEEFLEAGDTG